MDNQDDLLQEFNSILAGMKLCDQKFVYVAGRPEC